MTHKSRTPLDNAIYEKYIKPIERARRPLVGVEFELPVVMLDDGPVDFSVIHSLTDEFIAKFGFTDVKRDDNGDVYSALSPVNDDGLSYDCSYNTLELSFGVETDLNVIYSRFVEYYTFIQSYLRPRRHALTGMGVNPHYMTNRREPIPSERYRMLFHHLSSYEKYGDAIQFHNSPDFGLFSCASQVQLDVEKSTVTETLNTFTKLEPLKSLLFANSLWGDLLCGRDHFWKNSLHGLNPHNVDMYAVEFHSPCEIQAYIGSMSLYCVEREGKYINFRPTPLKEYFASETITGEYFDGEGYRSVTFSPEISDLSYLRSFKFEDLTYRGTVEFRSVCQQPVSDIMAPAAFHTGLLEKLHDLTELLDRDTVIYQKGYSAIELREIFNRRAFPDFVDRDELSDLLTRVIDLAAEGLKVRGLGEERFLEPLYSRARYLYNPARVMADGIDAGVSPDYYIEEYGKL